MAEIIYLKDILSFKPKEKISTRKITRPRLKPMRADKLLKSSLIERKKEDNKRN